MLRLTPRVLISAIIVLFWLGMMAWLVGREAFAPQVPPGNNRPKAAERPTDTWLGVYLPGDKRVGYIHVASRPERRDTLPGTALRMDAHLTLNLLGQAMEAAISGAAWLPHGAGKATFRLDVESGGEHPFQVQGTVGDGFVEGSLQTVGQSLPLRIPVSKDFDLSKALHDSVDVANMEVGKEYVIDTFDPGTMRMTKGRVQCVGEEVLTVMGKPVHTKIITMATGSIATTTWVSGENEIIRAEMPLGFILKKIAPEEALRAAAPDAAGDLLAKASIRPTGKHVMRDAKRMKVRLAGVDKSAVVPTDDTQTADEAGNVTVMVPPEPASSVTRPERDTAYAPFLEGDPLIQVNAPEIQRQSAAIVGTETNRWKSALLLYRWVHENIEKQMVFSIPSALDVLQTREGDCNEHTALFTALARAAGIPTRIAIGIVWSDELEGFYYHAWPEVFVDRWIWMDPTLGQPIADATHLKLLTGNIDKWTQLLPFIGQAQLEVVEIE